MADQSPLCESCGLAISACRAPGGRYGRSPRFCSNACRQRAYRRRSS